MTITRAHDTLVKQFLNKAKQGTRALGEAINKLHIVMMETLHAKWEQYDEALKQFTPQPTTRH